jgi:hypothetical protein
MRAEMPTLVGIVNAELGGDEVERFLGVSAGEVEVCHPLPSF